MTVRALHIPWWILSGQYFLYIANSAVPIHPRSPTGFSSHSALSCPLCLALENRALTPPLPNPFTNSPVLQWASIDSWIRTTLHCLPSLAFCQELSQLWKSCTSPEPNLFFAQLLFFLPFLPVLSFLFSAWLFSECQRACEYLLMRWHRELLCAGLDGVQKA